MECMRRGPLLLSCLLILVAPTAHARSAFVLPAPVIEPIPAGTYDDDGQRLGEATLYYERRDDGRIHMQAVAAMEGGPRNIIKAVFEEIDDGRFVRVLHESSLSHDADGKPMVLVEIDHEKREARCTPPAGGEGEIETLSLDEEDRVANTTMGLLFQPLALGDVKRVEFQAFLCRGGARLVDFVALHARPSSKSPDPNVVEIRFGPNLGSMMSWLASVVVPKLRFWFDAEHGRYLAHRMPLYGGGPEVVVAREGVSAGVLGQR
jgi:hypothetical protein